MIFFFKSNGRTKSSKRSSSGGTRPLPDQSELERKFNQYLTHSEQQNQHQAVGLDDDECDNDERVWLNRKKAGVGSSASASAAAAVRSGASTQSQQQQQQQQYTVENEISTSSGGGSGGGGGGRSRSSANSRSRTAIERIMMEEKRLQQVREKERLISSSRNTGDETTSLSTNASSRYIRNNSYLNANPTLNVLSNGLVILP